MWAGFFVSNNKREHKKYFGDIVNINEDIYTLKCSLPKHLYQLILASSTFKMVTHAQEDVVCGHFNQD